jgi:hypothetical protein
MVRRLSKYRSHFQRQSCNQVDKMEYLMMQAGVEEPVYLSGLAV